MQAKKCFKSNHFQGHSPGGGCLIACSCDYRVMVQGKYTIGLNETQLGLVVPTWYEIFFIFLCQLISYFTFLYIILLFGKGL